MLVGPVFTRELAIAPRRTRTYMGRSAYVLALLLLTFTAWLLLTGTQIVRDVGDLARFGAIVFHLLAPLQLALAAFFAAITAAIAVSHEKDRKTLVLLLLTRLTNSELVLGKLLASLLNMLAMLLAALPLFLLLALLGGVSFGQIARVFAVTLSAAAVSGSLGSIVALGREKTFQALAMTALLLVLWLGLWEIVASMGAGSWLGLSAESWAVVFSPWRAVQEAAQPWPIVNTDLAGPLSSPVTLFLLMSVALTVVLNGAAIALVRKWNTSPEAREFRREDEAWKRSSPAAASEGSPRGEEIAAESPSRRSKQTRAVWDNPIIWREIRTWAYGRRMLVVRLAYLAIFAASGLAVASLIGHESTLSRATGALTIAPLFFLSLVLVNAQAVTAVTSERDARTLDLLLVSDLTPKEIVYGKLGGILYNTKEMILLPLGLCVYLGLAGALSWENLSYLLGGLVVLYAFAAMLGLHAGMTYGNSRSAITTSLGTVFFLFLGVAICMRLMVAFSGSFQTQLQAFLAFMIGGGIGLYAALGMRNPSGAIGWSSFLCPAATFYAIVSFLLEQYLAVFLVVGASYGFMTAAMLVPAVYEFDVATGRTTAGEAE